MPINNLTHFVLVDFENVPGVDLSLLGTQPLCVTLFLGLKSKLKPVLVDLITTLPFEVRLIKVGMTKKNALDFVLAFHLGEMVSRHPRGHFYIVSGDKRDFEPLVTHLRDHHVHVSRHEDIASLPFLNQPETNSPVKKTVSSKPNAPAKAAVLAKVVPQDERLEKLITRLKNNAAPRPKTRSSLLARIGTDFGNKLSESEQNEKLDELVRRGVLTIDAKEKVAYA